MKQLIEQQREDFEKRFKIFEQVAHDEVDGTFAIEHDKEKVWNWHKQSLKQFIDGLIEAQNEHMQKELSVERFARPDFYKGYEAAKKNTIAHLKKLKEEIN